MAVMTAEPHWPRPPGGGWAAPDLDRLPDLPAHTELVDGGLVFVSPQRKFHSRAVSLLHVGLRASAPDSVEVEREMSTGVHRGVLTVTEPYPTRIDLAGLTRGRA